MAVAEQRDVLFEEVLMSKLWNTSERWVLVIYQPRNVKSRSRDANPSLGLAQARGQDIVLI